jgi:hypothetical protein
MNDSQFDPGEKEYRDLTIDISSGKLDNSAAAAFFKKHVHPA